MSDIKLHRQPAGEIVDHQYSLIEDGGVIALMNKIAAPEGEQHLKDIVKAYNSHEALLKALKDIWDNLDHFKGNYKEIRARGYAAIAEAETDIEVI